MQNINPESFSQPKKLFYKIVSTLSVKNNKEQNPTGVQLAQTEDGKPIVIKTIEAPEQSKATIEREIGCLAGFGHLLGFSFQETSKSRGRRLSPIVVVATYTIVMDVIPGKTVDKFVESLEPNTTTEQWFSIIWGMTSELNDFHAKGLAHRDAKPDNFMISKDGIKLYDFGNSIIEQEAASNPPLANNPAFMAPETIPPTFLSNQLSDAYMLGRALLCTLGCISIKGQYNIPEPDFEKQIPERLGNLGFTLKQRNTLIKIIKGLLHKTPEERTSVTQAFCSLDKMKEKCAFTTNFTWIEDIPIPTKIKDPALKSKQINFKPKLPPEAERYKKYINEQIEGKKLLQDCLNNAKEKLNHLTSDKKSHSGNINACQTILEKYATKLNAGESIDTVISGCLAEIRQHKKDNLKKRLFNFFRPNNALPHAKLLSQLESVFEHYLSFPQTQSNTSKYSRPQMTKAGMRLA